MFKNSIRVLMLVGAACAVVFGGRGRPVVTYEYNDVVGEKTYKLLSDKGTILRSATGWSNAVGKNAWTINACRDVWLYTDDFWITHQNDGLNALRLIFMDGESRAEGWPHWDINVEADRNNILKQLDSIVYLASKHDMYVVINYHEVYTGKARFDLEYCKDYWSYVAPRYKDSTHVLYELNNEPYGTRGFSETHAAEQVELFAHVRPLAPETHLMLCSFPQMGDNWRYNAPDTCRAYKYKYSMLEKTRMVDSLGKEMGKPIDWSNASVAFHTYAAPCDGTGQQYVIEMMKNYACIATEIIVPEKYADNPCNPGVKHRAFPLAPGETWQQQTLERLGVGWFTWWMDNEKDYTYYYKAGLFLDATLEGWLWTFDKDIGATAALKKPYDVSKQYKLDRHAFATEYSLLGQRVPAKRNNQQNSFQLRLRLTDGNKVKPVISTR